MVSQCWRAILACFLLTALWPAQSVCATETSHIGLKSNHVYEHVTFEDVNRWRSLSLPHVLRITGENGEEITINSMGRYLKPPEEGQKNDWPSEQQTQRKTHPEQPFDIAVSAGVHYSIPTGDYYRGIKSGIGYGLDVVAPLGENMAVRGSISKLGMQDDLKSLLSGVIIIKDNLDLSVWRYVVFAQFYLWPDWRRGGRTMYYLCGGIGGITHRFSGSMTIQDPGSGEIGVLYGTGDKESNLLLSYGAGFLVKLSGQIGIDVGASWDIVFVGSSPERDPSYSYQGEYANILDLKVRLVGLF